MNLTWAKIASMCAVVGACGALYLHLQTDLEASEMKKAIDKDIAALQEEVIESNETMKRALDRSEIIQLQREVRKLKKERTLPGADTVNIDIDIKYYEDLIACIRAQFPLCE